MTHLLSSADTSGLLQYILIGLANGSLYALIALGYTMVYGIIELINFAHGDLFMLGSFLALYLLVKVPVWLFNYLGVQDPTLVAIVSFAAMILIAPLFCAGLNWSVDRLVYKPLRQAPKLAPLVSAIGVSFIFMNIGLLWYGPADINFPPLFSEKNLLEGTDLRFTNGDLLVLAVTVPIMIGLTLFVKYTRIGKAMRATAQNPTAAQLMGINVDRVIGITFLLGGALGGAASVIYGLHNGTVSYQMGFQNGLYAFTAAVLGGIGNIPGAVLGAIIIGLVRSLGSGYLDERWTEATIFGILIIILVFRPTGLLGARTREKV